MAVYRDGGDGNLTRRQMLQIMAAVTGAGVLSACVAPPAAPQAGGQQAQPLRPK